MIKGYNPMGLTMEQYEKLERINTIATIDILCRANLFVNTVASQLE